MEVLFEIGTDTYPEPMSPEQLSSLDRGILAFIAESYPGMYAEAALQPAGSRVRIYSRLLRGRDLYGFRWMFYRTPCTECSNSAYSVNLMVQHVEVENDFNLYEFVYSDRHLDCQFFYITHRYTSTEPQLQPFLGDMQIEDGEAAHGELIVAPATSEPYDEVYMCRDCYFNMRDREWNAFGFIQVTEPELECLICREEEELYCIHCRPDKPCSCRHHAMHRDCAIRYFECCDLRVCPVCRI